MVLRTIFSYGAAICFTISGLLYSGTAAAALITILDEGSGILSDKRHFTVKAVLRPNEPTDIHRAYTPPVWLKNTARYLGTSYEVSYKIRGVRPARSVTADQNIGGGGTVVVTKAFSQKQLVGTQVAKFPLYKNGKLTRNSVINYEPGANTILAPDGLILSSVFKTFGSSKSMANTGIRRGVAVAHIDDSVSYLFEVDTDSGLYKSASWLGNIEVVTPDDIPEPFTRKVRDTLRSLHILNERGRKLFYDRRDKMICLCVRGSIMMDGTSIYTASPGNLMYDVTFGYNPNLFLPFAFGENKDEATLEVFFDDNLLGSVNGIDYGLDELDFFQFDISNYLGMSGSLNFVLNTTGTQSANAFIPSSISTSLVSVPAPPVVWLFGTGLLGIIGMARRRTSAR